VERERVRVALAKDQEADVARLLTPGQLRRFKQIALQQRGAFAFSDPEVVTALELTPEQRKRVREIQDDAGPAGPKFDARIVSHRGPPPEGPPPFRPGLPPRPPERWADHARQAVQRLLDLLTPEQQMKWKELTGEPFVGEFHRGPPRFPGP
jgi:hypothetical protein